MLNINSIDLAVLGLGGLSIFLITKLRRRKLSRPPGPRGYPIIGNLLDLPATKAWTTFAHWGEQWGGIMSVKVLGQVIVVVNDPEIAISMLEAKGSIYADRPTMPMITLSGWGRCLSSQHFGSTFREYRKLIGRVIGTRKSMQQFYPAEEFQASMFLKRVLDNPQGLEYAVRKTAGALILDVTYGYKISEDSADPLVDLADKAMAQFSDAATPGRWLVDSIPILRYVPSFFPGAGFKRLAAEYFDVTEELAHTPLVFCQDQINNGKHLPSYAGDLLQEEDISAERIDQIKWSAASFYAAGSDTTVSVIYAYFMAIAMHPEVQIKAQAEIDVVIGRDRLPTLADRDSLPYCHALVQELFRWVPVVPLGLTHASRVDDVHDGYFIPAGSLIIANIWKFLHDPDVYRDPESFNPERFMGDSPERDPTDFCFGFGRRICPGMHLADVSVWINIVLSAAAFSVNKAVDAAGKPIDITSDFTDGVITRPKSFQCDIKPRHDNIPLLVQQATA